MDYVSDIRVHGDEFSPRQQVPGSAPALVGSTVDEVLGVAAERAEALGIGPDSRVLSTLEWTLPGGVYDGLLAVLSARSSLVQVSNPDPDKLAQRRTTEKTTVDLGAVL